MQLFYNKQINKMVKLSEKVLLINIVINIIEQCITKFRP